MKKFICSLSLLILTGLVLAGSPSQLNVGANPGPGAICDGYHRVTVFAVILDSAGDRVYSANNTITFNITSGSGTFEGSNVVQAKGGLATVNVISPTSPGSIVVTGTSPGLTSDITTFDWIEPRIAFTKFPLGVYEDVAPWWYSNFSTAINDIRAHNLDSCMMGNGKVGRDEGVLNSAESADFDIYMGIVGTVGESGSTPDFYDDSTPTLSEARVQRDEVLNNWGGYSCVQSWYTADEPDNSLLTHVGFITEAFREQDTLRPATPVLIGKDRTRNHYNQSQLDVLCPDLYPAGYYNPIGDFTMRHWGYSDMDMVSYYRYITQDKHGGVPSWLVLQTHNFQTQLRQPEPEEVRCMQWLGIAEGVKGFFWFIYSPINSQWTGLKDQPANFGEIATQASRLKANGNEIINILKNSQRTVNLCSVSGPTSPSYIQPHITTLMKKDGSDYYTVAVNQDCQDYQTLTIDSYHFNQIKDVETDTIYSLPVSLSFAPGNGRIFELLDDPVDPPNPPENCSVYSTAKYSISISWDPPVGGGTPNTYNIYYAGGALIDSVPAGQTNYTIDSLDPATDYCFEVTAENAADESSPSNFVCDSTQEQPDLNEDGLVDDIDLEIFTFNWLQSVSDPLAGDINGSGFVDLRDFAYLAAEWYPDSQAPDDIDDLEIADYSYDYISLVWTEPYDNVGVESYDIYRKVGTGSWGYLDTVYTPTVSYNDSTVLPETSYNYRIKTYDTSGNPSPAYSNEVSQLTPAEPTDDSLHHWDMGEGTGSTVDNTGSAGSPGGNIDGADWEYESSIGRNVLHFIDDNDDNVSLGNMDLPAGTSGLTLCAWVKADTFKSGADNRIISKANGSAANDHWWMLSTIDNGGVKLRFRLKTNGTTETLIGSSQTIPTDQWVHVAAIYDGSTMRLYKNGVADSATISKSGNVDTNSSIPAYIGINYNDYSPWDGWIYDVRIYDRALSASELSDIINE
jgi:hypothetical protein